MNIDIVSYPIFYLPLTLDDVGLLGRMANMHYDSTCRSISKLGGFLYGWSNVLTFDSYSATTDVKVRAEWRELDVLCKVMELLPSFKGHFTDEEYSRVESISKHVHGAMRLANECHGSWQKTYEGQ